jgi:hypothetical protein
MPDLYVARDSLLVAPYVPGTIDSVRRSVLQLRIVIRRSSVNATGLGLPTQS